MKAAASILALVVALALRAGAQWSDWSQSYNQALVRSNLVAALDERVKAAWGDAYTPTNMLGDVDNVPEIGRWNSLAWLRAFDGVLLWTMTNRYVNTAAMATNVYHGLAWEYGPAADATPWGLSNALASCGWSGETGLVVRSWWSPAASNYAMRRALLNLMTNTAAYWTTWVNPAGAVNRTIYEGALTDTWAHAWDTVASATNEFADGEPHAMAMGEADTMNFRAYSSRGMAWAEGGCTVTSFVKRASLWTAAAPAGAWDAQGDAVSTNWSPAGVTIEAAKADLLWTNAAWTVSGDLSVCPHAPAAPDAVTNSLTVAGWVLHGVWLIDWTDDEGGFKYK